MAADGKLQAELNRVFELLGKLQKQSSVMATNLTTLNLKINNSAEVVDMTQEESTAGKKDLSAVLEEREEGAEMMQVKKDNQRPSRSGCMEDKVRMSKIWFEIEIENEEWGSFPMESPKDLWITNVAKVKIGPFEAFGILGLGKNKKQDLDSSFEHEGLVGKDLDPFGSKMLRDWMSNIKDCQQNRLKGTERDLKASDVIDPG